MEFSIQNALPLLQVKTVLVFYSVKTSANDKIHLFMMHNY